MLHKLAAEHDEALRDDWREFILENREGITTQAHQHKYPNWQSTLL